MATARSFPASALLKDGRVIVIGGKYIKDPVDTTLGTAEISTDRRQVDQDGLAQGGSQRGDGP